MQHPEELTDGALKEFVRKAQEGDTEAFARVYDHFFTQIYRYAAFRLPPEIAEDTAADIFVKIWEKLHTYREQAKVPFGAWVFRIARHCVIDAYRAHRHVEEMPEEGLVDPDMFNRAENRMERAETLRTVREALEKLPKRYREVLLLTYIADLPNSEAARVLRMSEGGLRILKMRALRKLEALLPPETSFPT